MDFFNSAVETLQTLVVALGAGLGAWGVIFSKATEMITPGQNHKELSNLWQAEALPLSV